MAGERSDRPDVLLVVTSDRYGRDQFGTIRRLIDTALRSGHSLRVWACGYANMLTERGEPGEALPEADIIGNLVASHADEFSWVACRTCSDARGAEAHIDGVLTEPSFANFRDYVESATKVVYIGGD